MIETLLLTAWIAYAITVVRHGRRSIAAAWSIARWYERAGMLLVFVPIPGPIDELIALAIVVRVNSRAVKEKRVKHYDYDSLPWEKWGDDGWQRASVSLLSNETAWNPASTKHVLYGPAEVTYERGPDGGVSAYVE